jgi:hypothetical protein
VRNETCRIRGSVSHGHALFECEGRPKPSR